jgi:hypothetical protein
MNLADIEFFFSSNLFSVLTNFGPESVSESFDTRIVRVSSMQKPGLQKWM